MRNTLTLLNLGDFDVEQNRGDPYVQLLATTNPSQAHQEFVAARMNGVDQTGDPKFQLLATGQSSPVPARERVAKGESFVRRRHHSRVFDVDR